MVGVTSLVCQIDFKEYYIAQPFGEIFKLFYNLLSFSRAHVYFYFSLAFIGRGCTRRYLFSVTSPWYLPLCQRLFPENTPLLPFVALGASGPSLSASPKCWELISPRLPLSNDGCQLVDKFPATSPFHWSNDEVR